MNIEELIAGLKEKGMSDEQIKAELLKIKEAIDGYLNPAPAPETPAPEPEESDEDKEHRVFGI